MDLQLSKGLEGGLRRMKGSMLYGSVEVGTRLLFSVIWLLAFLWCSSIAQPQAPVSDSATIPFEGRISLDCRLEPAQVAAGDTTVFHVQVSWKGPTEDFIFFAPNVPESEGLSFSHMQTVNEKKGTVEGIESKTIFLLHFVAEKPGQGRIGDLQIKFLTRGGKEPEVLSSSGRPVIILPAPRHFPWVLAVKLLATVGLAAVFAGITIRIRKEKARQAAAPPMKTPLEKATEALTMAHRKILEGDASGYYHEVSGVLRQFLVDSDIAGTAGLPVQRMIQALEGSPLDDSSKTEARSLLSSCEEMRFSGIAPEQHELELFETRVRNLLGNLSGLGGSGDKPKRAG